MEGDKPQILWTRKLELVLVVVGLLVTAFVGWSANRIADQSRDTSDQLAAIEKRRDESESERAAARDFVARYVASSCETKTALIRFPLERFYNLVGDATPDEVTMRNDLCATTGGAPKTFVVHSINNAGPSGDDEYLVTATLLFDSGGDDQEHLMDGTAAMEMVLTRVSEGPVRTADDLRLISIAEVLCWSDQPCSTG